jgi:hypothetical protein
LSRLTFARIFAREHFSQEIGHLVVFLPYSFTDGVLLTRRRSEMVTAPKIKIVACKSGDAPEAKKGGGNKAQDGY